MDPVTDDTPLTPEPPRSFASRILFAVRHLWIRILDYASKGVDERGREIHISGRVFDEAWYLEKNPDIGDYDGSFAQHFFNHGLDEGRPARFFDSHWYYRHHSDAGLLRMDAWTHYTRFGVKENRAARFLYVNGGVERPVNRNYGDWVWRYDTLTPTRVQNLHGLRLALKLETPFSVLLNIEEADDPELVSRVLRALKDQIYPHLECVVGVTDAVRAHAESVVKSDKRFKFVMLAPGERSVAQKLLDQSNHQHIVFIRTCDVIDPAALLWVAAKLNEQPSAQVIYADEDRMDDEKTRKDPYFKAQFNYELFLTHNMLGGFVVYNRELVDAAAVRPSGMGDEDAYELALQVYEREGASAFVHIPRVLNHVRGQSVYRPGPDNALVRHFSRIGRSASISPAPELRGFNRVRYNLPRRLPKVSIIVPTRDKADLLRFCLGSLLEKTTYSNYEVIIVNNGSVEAETFQYFKDIQADKRVRVIDDGRPFNFSALNNGAVDVAKGSYICLMNNDIEIITPDWLEEMLSFAQQPEVGCVGARLWYPNDTLQHGGVLVGFFDVAGHMHKHIRRGEHGYANRASLHQSLSAVTAAVLLVKKSVYQELNGLDETLAVAFNDVDFCLRVRDAGYRNIYTPYAEMYHHESASRGAEDSPEKKAREKREIQTIKTRYGERIRECPAFNPNLSLTAEDLSFAFPPRVPSVEEILLEMRKNSGDVTEAPIVRRKA